MVSPKKLLSWWTQRAGSSHHPADDYSHPNSHHFWDSEQPGVHGVRSQPYRFVAYDGKGWLVIYNMGQGASWMSSRSCRIWPFPNHPENIHAEVQGRERRAIIPSSAACMRASEIAAAAAKRYKARKREPAPWTSTMVHEEPSDESELRAKLLESIAGKLRQRDSRSNFGALSLTLQHKVAFQEARQVMVNDNGYKSWLTCWSVMQGWLRMLHDKFSHGWYTIYPRVIYPR